MAYLDLTLIELHEAIIDGKVSPLQLVTLAIQRAKEDNNNAFEYIYEKEAIEAVNKLDENKKDNLLYGIPIVVKDNFSTKNIPTTASSNILNNYVPIFSAEVIDRLEQQGAIIIGKTTLDELAMGGSGTTGHKGITYNPWDPSHTHLVGGSSCGSAAAIANSIVPFALGSDTGDSIRKPASYAGLVGLKPTWGRISRFGLFPFAPSLDHVGYFTRSVLDSAAVLSLLAGRDEKDVTSSTKEVEDYTKNINNSLKNMRIAVIKQVIDSIKDEKIKEEFYASVQSLKQEGATVDIVDMDIKLLQAIFPTYIIISCCEATSNNANLDGIKFGDRQKGESYEEVIKNTRSKGFSELIRRRFVIGSFSLLSENRFELFDRAQKCRHMIVDAFNEIFKSYDAIYIPASPTTAPLIKDNTVDKLSDEYLIADNVMAFGNFGGYPSLTLPIGIKDGLPFGANLTTAPFNESKLFNIAFKIEQHTGYINLNARGEEE